MYNGTSQLWTLLGQIEVSWLKRYPLLEVSLCIKLLLELHWVSLFQNEGFYCITCFTTLHIFIMYDHVILILYYYYYFVSFIQKRLRSKLLIRYPGHQQDNFLSWPNSKGTIVLLVLYTIVFAYTCIMAISL